jgi:hypothetical protein
MLAALSAVNVPERLAPRSSGTLSLIEWDVVPDRGLAGPPAQQASEHLLIGALPVPLAMALARRVA